MSTEAAVATSVSSTPVAVSGDPNAFTPDELAMLEGKTPEAKPAPVTNGATASPPAKADGAQGEADADADGEGDIEVGADGTIRDLKTGRFVRHEAFMRTKNLAKAETERANRLAAEVVRNRERLAIYSELQPPAETQHQPARKEAPKPEEDIFGAYDHLKQEFDALKQEMSKSTTETNAKIEARETDEYFRSDLAKFTTSKPDFDKALQHATITQDKILQRRGVADPNERQRMIITELQSIIKTAKEAGKSWAETVYGIAEDYGYKPEAPAGDVNAVTPEARAAIDRINKGQEAGLSLRGSGSGGVPETMTIAKLADMPEREFLKVHSDYVGKHGVQAWNDFMAGKRGW